MIAAGPDPSGNAPGNAIANANASPRHSRRTGRQHPAAGLPLPEALPPLLAPAAASFLGATLGWLAPNWRLVLGLALLSVVVLSLLYAVMRARMQARTMAMPQTASGRMSAAKARLACDRPLAAGFRSRGLLLSLACFLFCFGHLTFLIHIGRSAQERLAGGIHRITGTVERVISPADPERDDRWGRIALRLPDGAIVQVSGGVGALLPGQRIAIQASFAIPEGQRNPGGFDERLYLARDGIFLKGDLFLNRLAVEDARTNPIGVAVLKSRQSLARTAQAILPQAEAALLLGILMGDTSQMSREEKAAFQAAGLSHLTAVSGANVAFLMTPAAFLLSWVLRLRRSRISALIGFVCGFGFLTGWEASVTRAILMAGLALAGKLLGRRSDPLNALLFAATAMLLAKPLLILSLSFHLSFLATAGILLGQARLAEWLQRWLPRLPAALHAIMALNLSVQITVLPLQAMATGIFSPLSLLANLPALPLAEGATLLGAALMLAASFLMPLAGHWPFLLAVMQAMASPVRFLLQALSRLAALFADDAWPRFLAGGLPALGFITLFLLSGCLLVRSSAWRRRLAKAAALTLAASMIVQFTAIGRQPELEIWMLDVGQGDALVIRARDGTVTLVDAGTVASGADVVGPALQALGIRKATQAIATHGHADHAGGLIPLMAAGRIGSLRLPQVALDSETAAAPAPRTGSGGESDVLAGLLEQAVRSDVAVQGVRKGDTIPLGSGAALTVLAPETPASADLAKAAMRRRGANAASLVMKLATASGHAALLLMGDCDQETENALLHGGQGLKADVLRVAHHGSNATTGKAFLATVEPGLALISVGRNDYGHPAPAMLDRLAGFAIPVVRSDRQGAVILRLYGSRSTVATYLPMPSVT